MATAQIALQFARTYLNDVNGVTWSDAVLMPFLGLAHTELVMELNLNNLGTLKAQTSPIVIPVGITTMSTNQPSNLINPIAMMEGDVGADIENYENMVKVTFLPLEDQDNWLTYWAFLAGVITFLGATSARSVILRYEGSIATPNYQTDQLGVIGAENFLGPRIVSLAYSASGRDSGIMDQIAQTNLRKIIQSMVVDDQRPTRRRGYRSSKGMYSPGR